MYIKNRSILFSCRNTERDCMMPSNPLIVFSFLLRCPKIKPFPTRTNEQQNHCSTAAKLKNSKKGVKNQTAAIEKQIWYLFFLLLYIFFFT